MDLIFFFRKIFFEGFLWWPNSRSEVPAEGGSELRTQICPDIASFFGLSVEKVVRREVKIRKS